MWELPNVVVWYWVVGKGMEMKEKQDVGAAVNLLVIQGNVS